MLKGVVLVGLLTLSASVAHAENDKKWVTHDGKVLPAATREICTTTNWGVGEVRTECWTEEIAPKEPNPALKGICTTLYGKRTCY
jgi:hypothetical protein